jgi:hypothetical protein
MHPRPLAQGMPHGRGRAYHVPSAWLWQGISRPLRNIVSIYGTADAGVIGNEVLRLVLCPVLRLVVCPVLRMAGVHVRMLRMVLRMTCDALCSVL